MPLDPTRRHHIPRQRLRPFPLRCVPAGPRLRDATKAEDFTPPTADSPRRLNRSAKLRRPNLPQRNQPPAQITPGAAPIMFVRNAPAGSCGQVSSKGARRSPSQLPDSGGTSAARFACPLSRGSCGFQSVGSMIGQYSGRPCGSDRWSSFTTRGLIQGWLLIAGRRQLKPS